MFGLFQSYIPHMSQIAKELIFTALSVTNFFSTGMLGSKSCSVHFSLTVVHCYNVVKQQAVSTEAKKTTIFEEIFHFLGSMLPQYMALCVTFVCYVCQKKI